jgi:hypothetical protein
VTGLIVIGFVIAYLTLFWVVAAKAKSLRVRIATVAVALLIPFWEFPVGFANFQSHCIRDGGVHLSVPFPPLNTVLIEISAGYTPNEVTRHGLKFVEYRGTNGITKYSSGATGLVKSNHSSPSAAVLVERTATDKLPWNLERTVLSARRIENSEPFAHQTAYHWFAFWWQRGMGPIFGSGFDCGWEPDSLLAALARGKGAMPK